MKKIFYILFFLCVGASAQVQKMEAIGLDTLTTAERDAITVPGDRAYIIYNETTGQFEYSAKGGAWQVLGGGGGGLTDMNWSDPIDANLIPDGDGTRNLGSSAASFGSAWIDGILSLGSTITGDILPTTDSSYDLGSTSSAFGEAYLDNLTLEPQGSSVKGWEIRSQTSGDDLVFLAETGSGTNLYTSVIYKLNDSGTPTDATDLVTKTYADANYSGDVTSASTITDNSIVRGDGGSKGIQQSGWTLSDTGQMTAGGSAASLNMDRLSASTGVAIYGMSSLGFSDGVSSQVMGISAEGTDNGDFEIYEQGDTSSSLNYTISSNTWRIGASPIITQSNAGSLGIGGDVVGPASATDNAIARFDTTTGKLLQNSGVTIDDSGNIATPGTVDGVDISALTGTDVALTDSGAYFTTDNVEAALQEIGADLTAVEGDILEDNNITLPSSTARYVDIPASSDFIFRLGGLTDIFTLDGAGAVSFDNYAPSVPDLAYAGTWNGSTAVPTRNAVYNEMEKKVNSYTTGEPTGSDTVSNIVSLTQAEYDAGTPVAGTAYIITDAREVKEYVIPLGPVGDDLATGTFVNFVPVHQAITITGVSLHINTAPTGSVATIDINEDGVSILSTKLTVDATENWSSTAATAAVISDSAIDANSVISVDIDGVGSTTPGTDGTVTIYYTVD